MKNLIILFFLIPIGLKAQDNPLTIFKSLENYIWIAEGKWGDGSTFKQEINLEFSLDNKIVKVESMGFINNPREEIQTISFKVGTKPCFISRRWRG